ncbi:MAG: hypothetical protein HUU25_15420 [Candidatus Sumerlaeia bacterium]|nr:hypothetical protein [Candidatus Sumerlaeia bacterium]
MSDAPAAAAKSLDPLAQAYIGALGLMMLCVLVFAVFSFDIDTGDAPAEAQALIGAMSSTLNANVPALIKSNEGRLIFFAGLAGIGLLLYATFNQMPWPWLPSALVACGSLAVVMFIIVFFRAGGDAGSPLTGDVDVDLTFMGYYVPFLAAIGATVIAAKRVSAAK